MSSDTYTLREALKAEGYSLTSSRMHVFKALASHDPQSMSDLLQHCPDIDRASVYRTVALFEKLGIVQRVAIGWKYKLELSDQFHRHHHHLLCEECGALITLHEDSSLEARLRELANTHSFSMRSHQLEIQGLCENCIKT